MSKKILVIRFSSIGDIVLTTPVVRALHLQIGAEVHYLTKKGFVSIVDSNPHVTKVITLDDDFQGMIGKLKTEQYDLIIDLHHNLRTKRIKRALGVPSSSFYKLNLEKWLIVHLGIDRLPDIHIVDRYLATTSTLGIVKDEQGLDIFIPEDQQVDLKDSFGMDPGSYVAIVIGAAHQTKCLTAEQIAGVCDRIDKHVILLGGKDENTKAEQIISLTHNQHVKNACEAFSILQSASLLQQSGSILTHDTGLMHMAAALKLSQVVIWGNTIPRFGMYPYYGDEPVRWISFEQTELKCRPCSKLGHVSCPKGHFKCILQHNLDDIAAAILSLFNS